MGKSSISLNVYNDFEQKNNYGAYAAITYTWEKYTASAIAEASNGTYEAGVRSRVRWTARLGSYGYSVTALEGSVPYQLRLRQLSRLGLPGERGCDGDRQECAGYSEVDGAVAFLNGVHFANRIDNSFAVVDTGIPNARVLYENNPIGETDSDGTLLLYRPMRAREEN